MGISSEHPSKPSIFIETDLDDYIISEYGDLRDISFVENMISSFEPEIAIHISEPFRMVNQPDYADFFKNSQLEIYNLVQTIYNNSSVTLFINLTPDFSESKKLYIQNFENPDIVDLIISNIFLTESFVTVFRKSSLSDNTKKQSIFNLRLSPIIGGGDWSLLNPFEKVKECNHSHKNHSNAIHVIDAINGIAHIIKTEFTKKSSIFQDFTLTEKNIRHKTDIFTELSEWKPLINLETAVKLTEGWYDARKKGADMKKFSLSQIQNNWNV
jgi:hypothetical protein